VRSAAAALAFALGCVPAAQNETSVGVSSGAALLLRNESTETICYVYLSPASQETWGPDRLRPDEVVDPGVTRNLELPPGRYDIRLLDCNRTTMLERLDVEVSGDGVLLTFRARE